MQKNKYFVKKEEEKLQKSYKTERNKPIMLFLLLYCQRIFGESILAKLER